MARVVALVGLCTFGPRGVAGRYDAERRIESCRVYGSIVEDMYYYIDLLIGTPPQRVSVIVDTGSHVVAFPCASCDHCGTHIDPNFDYAKSATAEWLTCHSGCSGTCKRGHCAYHQGYTEGSSISGYWFNDLVRLGDALQQNPPVRSRLGCHMNENKLFYTQRANGIMGIGPSNRDAGPQVLEDLLKDKEHVASGLFSMCLAEYGGRMTLGGWNESYHAEEIQWASLDSSRGMYHVPLTSMTVDGTEIGAAHWEDTVVDSGTTFVYMGSGPYQQLRGAIEAYCAKHDGCGARHDGECFIVPRPGPDALSKFPPVTIRIGATTTTWLAKGYLFRKGAKDKYCYAFANDGPDADTVLGAAWMLHHEVIFDLPGRRLGIAAAHCPEFRLRPEPEPVNESWLPGPVSPHAASGVPGASETPAVDLASLFAVLIPVVCVAAVVGVGVRRSKRRVGELVRRTEEDGGITGVELLLKEGEGVQ